MRRAKIKVGLQGFGSKGALVGALWAMFGVDGRHAIRNLSQTDTVPTG